MVCVCGEIYIRIDKDTCRSVFFSLMDARAPLLPAPKSREEEDLEDTIAERLQRLEDETDPAALNTLRDDLFTLSDMRKKRLHFWSTGPLFREDHVHISDRIHALAPPEYRLALDPPLDVQHLPGGYHVRDCTSDDARQFTMAVADYLALEEAWNNPKELSRVALREYLDDHCCSDWSKQDEHGECYGGHWKAEEGTEARENAYEWSRRDNLNALSALPYPAWAIIWTVEWGCSTRNESVAFTVFLCEWFLRKRVHMEAVAPATLIRFTMKEPYLPLPPLSKVHFPTGPWEIISSVTQ